MRIKNITFVYEGELNFGDFNVFVGGNGVGKSTFLLELFSRSTSYPKNKYYWIDTPSFETKSISNDLSLLKNSLSRKYENSTLYYYSLAAKDVGGNVDLGDNSRFSREDAEHILEQNENILNDVKFRKPFIAFSSCDSRLGLADEVGLTSYNQPAQDAINVLHRNKKLFNDIDKTIFQRVRKHFILLSHTGTALQLGVSTEKAPEFYSKVENIQDEYEKLEHWKEQKFTRLSESGHGIRSMIRLLTSLLDPVNQVVLIDEPEMHLYPSQKRWLGRQLVNLAKVQNKQVFLVTHDPIILQGILDANIRTNIFRLEREEGNQGVIKTCELDKVTDVNALRNQDQYLQSLFYQRCIVVEGASDRSFYQNMIEDYPEVEDKDLGFVSAGGKNNTLHIANITSKVGLNIAFIFDYDVLLFNQKLITDIYNLLGGETNLLTNLNTAFDANLEIKDATQEKDRNRLIKKLCGYSEKQGVTSTWVKQNHQIFAEVINSLAKKGIFIVPNGTLESWSPDVEPKVRFAELAPDTVRKNPDLSKQFKNFAEKVLSYLDIKIS